MAIETSTNLFMPGTPDFHQFSPVSDPSGVWPIGGYDFVGGSIRLGENVEVARQWEYAGGTSVADEVALKALVLATTGETLSGIAGTYSPRLSRSTLENTLLGVQSELGAAGRRDLLLAALGKNVLKLERCGKPEETFNILPYRLTQLAFLASRVGMSELAAASKTNVEALQVTLSRLASSKRVENGLMGSIAAAILTGQLKVGSGVPLVSFTGRPEARGQLLPVEDWQRVVTSRDPTEIGRVLSYVKKKVLVANTQEVA